MGLTRHSNSQALIDRVRTLRGAAQLTRDRAAGARGVVNPSPAPTAVATADRTRAWARLVLQGDGFVLVEVAGAVDIASQDELGDVLRAAVDSGAPAVIVDLSAVTLLAAAGLNCLQQTANLLAERGGRLHLVCGADGPAARSLRLFDPDGGQSTHVDVPAAVAVATGRV